MYLQAKIVTHSTFTLGRHKKDSHHTQSTRDYYSGHWFPDTLTQINESSINPFLATKERA